MKPPFWLLVLSACGRGGQGLPDATAVTTVDARPVISHRCSAWGVDGELDTAPLGVAENVIADPDGSVVIAGEMGTLVDHTHSGVLRLGPNGGPDSTFGDHGMRVDAFEQPYGDFWYTLDRLAAGGWFLIASVPGGVPTRAIRADGSDDATLCPTLSAPNGSYYPLNARQLGGQVLVAYSMPPSGARLERHDATCGLDPAYGNAGAVDLTLVSPTAMIRPDGGVLLAGDGRVVALDAAGAPLAGFGDNGVVILPPTTTTPRTIRTVVRSSVAEDTTGTILVALGTSVDVVGEGASHADVAIVHRISSAGVLDTTFGAGGSYSVPFPFQAESIAALSDGGFVLTGYTTYGLRRDPTIAWFDASGNPVGMDDALLHTGSFHDVAVLPDGRMIAVGEDTEARRVVALCFER